MRKEEIFKLRCPRCGWHLEDGGKLDFRGEELASGIVRCKCARYPIAEGILALNLTDPNAINRALSAIQADNPDAALFYLLQARTTAGRIIQQARLRHLLFSTTTERIRGGLINRRLRKVIHCGCFCDAVDSLKMGDYGNYFKYRFSTTSFIAAMPLLLLAEEFPGPVLEIGCGMGHLGFLISRVCPKRKLVLTDFSFSNLYLAKRFFVPDAGYICLDANEMLPFPPESFAAVLSSDTFHYLDAKSLAAREISRVSARQSCAVISHLHNRDKENPTPGNPLDAEGWLRLCGFSRAKLLPEEKIFNEFVKENKLDLISEVPWQEISGAGAFVLIGSSRPEAFRVYADPGGSFFKPHGNLIVNPLYEISREENGAQVVFKKRWRSEFIRAENLAIDELLPDAFFLDKDTYAKLKAGKAGEINQDDIVGLMRRFILINAPHNYASAA